MTDRMIQVPASLIEDVAGELWEDSPKRAKLLALLSQPEPSAEPPRVEDLAPGTTFTAQAWGGVTRYAVRVPNSGAHFDIVGGRHYIDRLAIDPSTIRDVIPPKETP